MKKRIKVFVAIMLICAVLEGCNNQQTVENHITQTKSEKDTEYILKVLNIDKDFVDNIICVYEDNIIYSSYEDNDTSLSFYKYSLNENRTYKLGIIANPYIDSGDAAINNDKIYLYCNTIDSDFSGDRVLKNSLYEIDLTHDEIKKLADDSVDQTLIYLNFVNDKVISFKGKINGNDSITYLDIYDTKETGNKKFEILVSKKFDILTQTGEIIYNFAQNDEILYAIVCTKDEGQILLWEIELYNLNGEQIGNIKIDTKTAQLLNQERISKFEVFDNYAFIRTFTGGGVLLNIELETTEPKILRESDFDIAISTDIEKIKNILLFSRDSGKIWKLDAKNQKLLTIDMPCETIRYIYLDDSDKVLLSSEEVVYGEIDEFSTSKEIELSNSNLKN